MFILTFVMGIKTLSNQNKSNRAEQEIVKDNQIEQNQGILEDETTKSDIQESVQDENNIDESIKEEITEEISVPEPISTVNYYTVGIFSFSAIFLSLTIIFAIFFTKYQLKAKKKTSKQQKGYGKIGEVYEKEINCYFNYYNRFNIINSNSNEIKRWWKYRI